MTIKGLRLPILGQPNPNEPKDVHLVGRYALGVTWADAHSSIYPFDRLRADDPAASHEPGVALTEAMGWPRDIKRARRGPARHLDGRAREHLSVCRPALAVPMRRLHGRSLMAGSCSPRGHAPVRAGA